MEKIMDTRSVDFLARLRSRTAISHERLESLPLSKLLVNPNIEARDYGLYLTLMHDVVVDIETNIFPIVRGIVPDLELRQKTDLILADLKTLGINKAKTIAVFDSEAIPAPGFALGLLYVLEGSTLGGRYILKNIEQNLGFTPENGARYFAGYGNTTGSLWKKFLANLTSFEAENNAEASIIAGADFAFMSIEKHLSQNSD